MWRDVECWSSPNARANDYNTEQTFPLRAPYADKITESKREFVRIRITYSEPLVIENLLDSNPVIYVGREHSLYKVFRRLANGIPEWCLHLQIQLNQNYSSRTGELRADSCAGVIKILRSIRFIRISGIRAQT